LSQPGKDDTSGRRGRFFASAARYTAAAVSLPSCVFVGYLVGRQLDSWLQTKFLYIVFLLIGVVAGFLPLLMVLKRDLEDK